MWLYSLIIVLSIMVLGEASRYAGHLAHGHVSPTVTMYTSGSSCAHIELFPHYRWSVLQRNTPWRV
jgi:hypothetical protein